MCGCIEEGCCDISIPYGAIKSTTLEKSETGPSYISIPYGAIKRAGYNTTFDEVLKISIELGV